MVMTRPGRKSRNADAGATQGLGAGLFALAAAARRHAKSYALAAAITVGLTVYVGIGLYNELRLCESKPIPSPLLLEDHGYYTIALDFALQRSNPYEVREVGKAFVYPPTALLVIEPFHYLTDFFTLVAAYTAVNLALMVIMVWGVARCYGHSLDRSWFLFPLALGFSPFLTGLHMGQINVITEFGIFLAFAAETAMPVVAGAGLALAICTKVTPVAFLGYYLVNKRFKAMAATLAAVAVLCVVAGMHYGWTPFLTYARLFPSLLHVYLLGCLSLVARLGVDESAAQSAQTAVTIYVAALVLAAGVCGFITKQREPLFIVVCLAAMLSPNIIWYHHFVFFLLPLLVWMAWSNFRAPVVLWCCGGLVLVQVVGTGMGSAICAHTFGHASMWFLLLSQGYLVWERFAPGRATAGGKTASREKPALVPK